MNHEASDDNIQLNYNVNNSGGTNINNSIIPSLEDVKDARKVLRAYNITKTPLQKSNTFSSIIGNNLYLKNESLQTTGTFKIRGALYKIDKLVKEHRIKNRKPNMSNNIYSISQNGNGNINSGGNSIGIIAASAGNHAQGVALASKINNLPC